MRWQQTARAQGGVVSHEQLAQSGLSRPAIARLTAAGRLVRLGRGVYLAGGAPLTLRARLWAAVISTGGVLARSTAGRLWGVYTDSDPLIHVALPHARRTVMPDSVAVHRQVIPPREVSHRTGLPTTSRRWTVLDLLATLGPADAVRLADRAVQRGWIDKHDCERRLRAQPHRPGNAQLRRVNAQLGDDAAATSERRLHQILRRAGLSGWIANHDVWSDGELVAVLDVAFPQLGLAIEVDGMAYHVDVDRFRRDRSRQNALVALGWTVLRFTWADLTERPGYVVATIRRWAA
jgi:very-short-patch-repair endonuclease